MTDLRRIVDLFRLGRFAVENSTIALGKPDPIVDIWLLLEPQSR